MGVSIGQVERCSVRELLDPQRGRLLAPSSAPRFTWAPTDWQPFLEAALDPEQPGFLGTWIAARRGADAPLELVDGFQRSVVLLLAIAAMREIEAKRSARSSESLSRYVVSLHFGRPPCPRIEVVGDPDAAALNHVTLADGRNAPSTSRGSQVLSQYRAIRRWLERRGEPSSGSEAVTAADSRTLLDHAQLALIVLAEPADVDQARARFGARQPLPSARSVSSATTTLPADDDQWSLELTLPEALPPLTPELTYSGTVWIPRILWALEWALRERLGPQSASDIARLLHAHAFLAVANTNIARAFRHHRRDSECQRMWRESEPLRYEILSYGREVLGRALQREPDRRRLARPQNP
ncbi:MAG: hypothetical protein AAFV36_01640 [Myxococcota bacterium]